MKEIQKLAIFMMYAIFYLTHKPIIAILYIIMQVLLKASFVWPFSFHYYCGVCCPIGWVALELWVLIHSIRIAVGR